MTDPRPCSTVREPRATIRNELDIRTRAPADQTGTEIDAPEGPPQGDAAEAEPSTPDETGRRSSPTAIALSAVGFIALWQLAVATTDLPSYMLPTPTRVAQALWDGFTEDWGSRLSLLTHLSHTVRAALAGFGIGVATAVILASGCARSRTLNRMVRPIVFGTQSMPKIALTPLIMVWFGFGSATKVILASLLVFFPMFVNTFTGLTEVEPSYFRLFRSYRASGWQTLVRLQFPSAAVAIFAGLEMGIVRAMLGAVVAEFLAGQNGIGVILIRFQYTNNTAGAFAALFLLGAASMALHRAMKFIRNRTLYWVEDA